MIDKAVSRRTRLASPTPPDWLSASMRRAIDEETYTSRGIPNPLVVGRYLSDLADEVGGVVALSGGTIGDMLPPEFVREAARNAVEDYPHYPGIKGHRDVRVAMAQKLERENGIIADPDDEILPTIGCQQVIDSTFRVLIDEGDEVLIIDPEYASTEPAIRMAGANIVQVPLSWNGSDWHFDFDELASRASEQTKLLVMSNPNNPTGIVYSKEELTKIADLAKALDFWVFSDEEYEKTLFGGSTHCSIASLPGMSERTITGFSFSKPFGMTAYRIGYIVGPATFIDHVYNILKISIQAVSAVGLRAAHAVLTGDMKPWLEASTKSLQAKRDYTVERLNGLQGIHCNTPEGVYFAFPDVRELGMTSFDLCELLVRDYRVSVAPGLGFGANGEGHVRFSFCPGMSDIEEGINRFGAAVNDINNGKFS